MTGQLKWQLISGAQSCGSNCDAGAWLYTKQVFFQHSSVFCCSYPNTFEKCRQHQTGDNHVFTTIHEVNEVKKKKKKYIIFHWIFSKSIFWLNSHPCKYLCWFLWPLGWPAGGSGVPAPSSGVSAWTLRWGGQCSWHYNCKLILGSSVFLGDKCRGMRMKGEKYRK